MQTQKHCPSHTRGGGNTDTQGSAWGSCGDRWGCCDMPSCTPSFYFAIVLKIQFCAVVQRCGRDCMGSDVDVGQRQ